MISYRNGKYYKVFASHNYNDSGKSWVEPYEKEISYDSLKEYPTFFSIIDLSKDEEAFFKISNITVEKVLFDNGFTGQDDEYDGGMYEYYKLKNGNCILYIRKLNKGESVNVEYEITTSFHNSNVINLVSFKQVKDLLLDGGNMLLHLTAHTLENTISAKKFLAEINEFDLGGLTSECNPVQKNKIDLLEDFKQLINEVTSKYENVQVTFVDLDKNLKVLNVSVGTLIDIRVDEKSWNEDSNSYEGYCIFKGELGVCRTVSYSVFKTNIDSKIFLMPYTCS